MGDEFSVVHSNVDVVKIGDQFQKESSLISLPHSFCRFASKVMFDKLDGAFFLFQTRQGAAETVFPRGRDDDVGPSPVRRRRPWWWARFSAIFAVHPAVPPGRIEVRGQGHPRSAFA